MTRSQISNIKYQISRDEQRTLFITGPTASGKSALAMRLAEDWNGEIICADSQTVRRGMDIGTAKPSTEDQQKVPHHLLDIIDPYERFTVADFVARAEVAIADIRMRGNVPIVVGGTGLYVDALLYGFSFRPTSSLYTRAELEAKPVAELQNIIETAGYPMPENRQNPRHLIRTIESEGAAPKQRRLREGAVVVGIDPGKDVLERRIEKRVDVMLQNGFLKELDRIVQKYGEPPHGFDAIEYRVAYENRGLSTEALRQKLIVGDRQYAKKQRAWMKRNKDIVWFTSGEEAYAFLGSRE